MEQAWSPHLGHVEIHSRNGVHPWTAVKACPQITHHGCDFSNRSPVSCPWAAPSSPLLSDSPPLTHPAPIPELSAWPVLLVRGLHFSSKLGHLKDHETVLCIDSRGRESAFLLSQAFLLFVFLLSLHCLLTSYCLQDHTHLTFSAQPTVPSSQHSF